MTLQNILDMPKCLCGHHAIQHTESDINSDFTALVLTFYHCREAGCQCERFRLQLDPPKGPGMTYGENYVKPCFMADWNKK